MDMYSMMTPSDSVEDSIDFVNITKLGLHM